MAKAVIELDGERTSSLEAFYDEVERKLIPGETWGRNLDAFNDILSGGFGTPPDGFVLRWVSSAQARAHLGYRETAKQLEAQLKRCHRTGIPTVQAKLEAARRGDGPTLFDILVEIIQSHESRDGIELELV